MVHNYQIRVRYSDTDQMKRLHHAAYVEYLEVVRIEMLRDIGYSYANLEKSGYLLPVIKLNLEYLGPAVFDDVIEFQTELKSSSAIRLEFRSVLTVNDNAVARAGVELVCLDAQSGKPRKLPEAMLLHLHSLSMDD
ncbi:MAG: thioesterase family protein [Bacteroidetes bacterium]|nr:thioesterase family protein [Bacteroidota bacterium]MDA1335854.1 thioesterase family protein [Bacteroidota bacterium]